MHSTSLSFAVYSMMQCGGACRVCEDLELVFNSFDVFLRCSVVHCVAVRCNALLYVAVLCSVVMMMMIAFFTFNGSLEPLIEGLCSSNPWEFEQYCAVCCILLLYVAVCCIALQCMREF